MKPECYKITYDHHISTHEYIENVENVNKTM